MKLYHKIVPYIMMGSATLVGDSASAQIAFSPIDNIPQTHSEFSTLTNRVMNNFILHSNRLDVPRRLAQRAADTRDKYVENMLTAQKNLAPKVGTRGYTRAVRNELPGAPVGRHCMYGQYTQLLRALEQNGDTLTIIPNGGERACINFKNQMRKKYGGPEYMGAIQEGRAFATDAEYNAALEKYLSRHISAAGANDSVARQNAVAEFARHNFSAQQVKPGAIWIVPRFRGAKNTWHAIMFLGAGRVESGEFIPDANGRMMYTAHNRERIGDLFKTWDTSNVFSADIEKILEAEYAKEVSRLDAMSDEQMIEYITTDTDIKPESLRMLPRGELLRLVHDKYFERGNLPTVPSTPSVPMVAGMMLQNSGGRA